MYGIEFIENLAFRTDDYPWF